MILIDWENGPQSRAQLDREANPSYADQPEVVPWNLYDTQAIANAAAGPFVFFGAINADKSLSNMEGPGQLPDPQFLIVHYVACDLMQAPIYTAAANEPQQGLGNIDNILKTARAIFTFNMSNKRYGPYSLSMCHALGGTTGVGYGYGAAALGNGQSFAVVNNGIPGSGGFPVCGAWTIPPKIGFDITINLAVAATLSATLQCRISLVGALYRRVL